MELHNPSPSIPTPVSVANGGTGATTAATARTNLGVNHQIATIDTTESTAAFNSTAFVDSTALQMTLDAGTYWIEWRGIIGDSGGAGAGTKCQHNFTGTGTFSGLSMTGNQDGANPPSFPTQLGFPAGSVAAATGIWAVGAAGQDITRRVKLVVTASGLLSVQKAQNAATVSTLSLYVGSYLSATRIG